MKKTYISNIYKYILSYGVAIDRQLSSSVHELF